jgi:carbon monoxide dehydrogenase subunit G
MDITLNKQYPIGIAPRDAWQILADIPATTACLPGAEIESQTGEKSFKGLLRCKIGPASINFSGIVEIIQLNASDYSLELMARGNDNSGSLASMHLQVRIKPHETTTMAVLEGVAKISISGKLAQFGSRMINPVADSMIDKFIRNLEQKAQQNPPKEPESQSLNLLAIFWESIQRMFASVFSRKKPGPQ